MPAPIKHVIVLMLENRSFDHMLGYLHHPNPFDGLKSRQGPTEKNARYAIYPGPDHSHHGAMHQLLGDENPPSFPTDYQVTNSGFAASYGKTLESQGLSDEFSDKIFRCLDERLVPVLSKLAVEYALCDSWFSSVPGETWPNRDFVHAATSSGMVDNSIKGIHLGKIPTIYDLLAEEKEDWRLYHDGVAHLWAFRHLFSPGSGNHSRGISELHDAIRGNSLPAYSFVEPDYGIPGKGNSQHPSQADSRSEFVAGELLIANIYNSLRENPTVFENTVFVVTYDEHGGFYDHVAPPMTVAPDKVIHNDNTYSFGFNLLGARVPTVIISPWIPRAKVDKTQYDHTSIIATVRKLFAPTSDPLTKRDADANTFDGLLTLEQPRKNLPEVEPLTPYDAHTWEDGLSAFPDATDGDPIFDHDLTDDFRRLARHIDKELSVGTEKKLAKGDKDQKLDIEDLIERARQSAKGDS